MTNQDKIIADLARKYVGTLTDIRAALATAAGVTSELWDRSQAASDALRKAVEAESRAPETADDDLILLAPHRVLAHEWFARKQLRFRDRWVFCPGDERGRMRGIDFTGRRVVVLDPERADMQALLQAARIQRADV